MSQCRNGSSQTLITCLWHIPALKQGLGNVPPDAGSERELICLLWGWEGSADDCLLSLSLPLSLSPAPPALGWLLPDSHRLGEWAGVSAEGPIAGAQAGGSVYARTQVMIDTTVTTSKSIFLEMSITHTPPSDSAFLSAIINDLLFKQTDFLLPREPFPQVPLSASMYIMCLTSVVLCAFPAESMCRGFSCCLCSPRGC